MKISSVVSNARRGFLYLSFPFSRFSLLSPSPPSLSPVRPLRFSLVVPLGICSWLPVYMPEAPCFRRQGVSDSVIVPPLCRLADLASRSVLLNAPAHLHSYRIVSGCPANSLSIRSDATAPSRLTHNVSDHRLVAADHCLWDVRRCIKVGNLPPPPLHPLVLLHLHTHLVLEDVLVLVTHDQLLPIVDRSAAI